MFEVFAKIGKNEFVDPYKVGHPFYTDKKFKQHQFSDDHFNLSCLYRGSDDFFIDTDDYYVAILGQVYFKYQYSGVHEYKLTAQELLEEINGGEDWLKKIKGNFTLFIYNKEKTRVQIINDQFALKPFYHTKINGEIIVSNNLNNFKTLSKSINEVVLLEKLLFNYSLDNQTILTGVKYLDPGQILEFHENKVNFKKYFRLSELVYPDDTEQFSVAKLQKLINGAVLQIAGKDKNAVASFTGGYDGRTIVSSMLKEGIDFSTYSFGKNGGDNTRIPSQIAEKLQFNHKAIYLEEAFEKMYAKYALESIYFSDGLMLFEKSIFPYAMDQLGSQNKSVLTGVIGGELFRPIEEPHGFINPTYYDIIYNENNIDFFTFFEERGMLAYIDKAVIDNNKQELFERVQIKRKEIKGKRKEKYSYLYSIYDFISLGFRRYYGGELHMERFYIDNLTPLFDYDILAYIFRTDFKSVYKDNFKSSIKKQLKAERMYAQILQLNYPKLLEFEVDRGYLPHQLNSALQRIGLSFKVKRKQEAMANQAPEFTPEIWSDILYKRLLEMDLETSKLFKVNEIKNKLEKDSVGDYNQSFNHLLGIYSWIHLV